jgi:hypothetical protein
MSPLRSKTAAHRNRLQATSVFSLIVPFGAIWQHKIDKAANFVEGISTKLLAFLRLAATKLGITLALSGLFQGNLTASQ